MESFKISIRVNSAKKSQLITNINTLPTQSILLPVSKHSLPWIHNKQSKTLLRGTINNTTNIRSIPILLFNYAWDLLSDLLVYIVKYGICFLRWFRLLLFYIDCSFWWGYWGFFVPVGAVRGLFSALWGFEHIFSCLLLLLFILRIIYKKDHLLKL